jgi:hypothetical protein
LLSSGTTRPWCWEKCYSLASPLTTFHPYQVLPRDALWSYIAYHKRVVDINAGADGRHWLV